MLKLENITKVYEIPSEEVRALKGVSVEFRKSEFVSVLGPSGCGKTTLLNIIGGLDRYTDGNLIIAGRSTKNYRDRDWDSYRNHSVGFVFQSYNLIPHQSVLANVELALTLSGVSKKERRARAKEALEMVGLGDKLRKKPNQLSGGQMQRVAIARALVNNPEILLADEPTGALDTETSVQIMNILRNIASDRLIIMVTHNPELAETYSSRIIRLLDGKVISDSNPYDSAAEATTTEEKKAEEAKPQKRKVTRAESKTGRTSMSFFTALGLSLNNLMTKKGRTILTAFAGSIGIIGIALILSLSTGARAYIDKVERDTLSSFPLTITQNTVDFTSFLTEAGNIEKDDKEVDDALVTTQNVMSGAIHTMLSKVRTNDLASFKKWLESEDCPMNSDVLSAISYQYSTTLNIYNPNAEGGLLKVNPSSLMSSMMGGAASAYSASGVFSEMLDNDELIKNQYEVLEGRFPERYDEVMLVVSSENEITDYTLYSLGLLNPDDLTELMKNRGEWPEGKEPEPRTFTVSELLGLTFRVMVNTSYFEKNPTGGWADMSDNEAFVKKAVESSPEIRVVGVVRPARNTSLGDIRGEILYRHDLMLYLMEQVENSEIVRWQKAHEDTDVFTGKPFASSDVEITFDISLLPPEQQAYLASLSEEELAILIEQYKASMVSTATYEGNLRKLGCSDPDDPSSIYLYPVSFEAKESIERMIAEYNEKAKEGDQEASVIQYTDMVGLLMSSITTIINAISYILIAFVAISLVVSSIMIGIITYISVLERTKEIGILRSIGASKRDVRRVFNAETLIIGFASGAIGIGLTYLLDILASKIIEHFTDISGLAFLPTSAAIVLVVISMLLTLIAGLFPAGVAARKDPVIALRTE